jgi:hypothetical protein
MIPYFMIRTETVAEVSLRFYWLLCRHFQWPQLRIGSAPSPLWRPVSRRPTASLWHLVPGWPRDALCGCAGVPRLTNAWLVSGAAIMLVRSVLCGGMVSFVVVFGRHRFAPTGVRAPPSVRTPRPRLPSFKREFGTTSVGRRR